MYIPRLMMNATGVQATLRFFLSNLNGYKVGTIDRRDSRNTPLRWLHVA
jgi:hypothetical protein